MELRQLRYFVKTAEVLNFSEAARALYVTQSTLSQQIRQLEEELDVKLFDRDSHSVSLTESGQHLLPIAKVTLQDAENCLTRISDLKRMLTGELNIGTTYSFQPVLTEAVEAFSKQFPGVKLNIVCGTMGNLFERLKHAELDFVLCFRPNTTDDEIDARELFDDHLSVILSEGHPLANNESFSIEDLRPHHLAMPTRETQARSAFDRVFPHENNKLNIQVEINDVNGLLDIVRTTRMLTVLSEATLYQKGGLKAVPLKASDTQMKGCVLTLKKAYRKRSADEFIQLLIQSDAVKIRAQKWLKK